MDDILILGIGRMLIEIAAQREQLLQERKKLQATQTKSPPQVEGD